MVKLPLSIVVPPCRDAANPQKQKKTKKNSGDKNTVQCLVPRPGQSTWLEELMNGLPEPALELHSRAMPSVRGITTGRNPRGRKNKKN